MNHRNLLLGALAIASLSHPASAVSQDPDVRARQTLAKMTLQEKIDLLHGPMPTMLSASKRVAGRAIGAGWVEGNARLGVPPLIETDASLGVSNLMNMRPGDVATAMPSGMALAASWDTALAHAAGAMIGSEARAKGFNVMLAGGVNLVRDPRGGRNFEYLGEDPLLAGMIAGQQIRGIQSNHIISTIKHFALNNQETGRNVASVEVPEAAARESDLLAFEIGLEQGQPGSVMCAYNRVDGIYACENPFLLNRVLRNDWGFKGFVMSDWGAVHSTEALLHGLDMQSGEQIDAKRYFSTLLVDAAAAGQIPQSAVNKAAGRVLRSIYAYGLADNQPVAAAIDYEAHARIAQTSAEEGIVLLRNERSLLPFNASEVKTIALIGGHADLGVLSGGGSSQVTPVGGFKLIEKAGHGPAVAFAKRGYGGTSPLEGLKQALPGASITYVDGADPAAAVAAAQAADLAIVVAEKYETEALDDTDLALGDGQDALIAAVATANPKTIVVLETGNPVLMPWREKVGAIVAAWFPGQRGGAAIARVLAGAVNPAGRLPVTFPARIEDLPNPMLPGSDIPPADSATRATYGLQAGTKPFVISYPEGSDVGYRWYDAKGLQPLFPFGFGLSYTSFRYGDLKIVSGKTLTVSFTVTNTGTRAGADVPQVYVVRPGKAKRLIGWGKPLLAPGATQTVRVTADPRLLADFDVARRRWVVPTGTYKVEVATSATQPVLTAQARVGGSTIKP